MAKIRAKKRSIGSGNVWLELPVLLRLSIALVIGIGAGAAIGICVSWLYAPLMIWDVTALIASAGLWLSVRNMDSEETKDHAVTDDPGRVWVDVILLTSSVFSLGAVLVLIVKASSATGVTQIIDIGLGVASVIISWSLVHFIYMLRYADLYFENGNGIDFNSKTSPTYQDFAYLAFTIGMTYQVSDTSITSSVIRKAARQHALLSYIFGTAIIATVINTLAGLGK